MKKKFFTISIYFSVLVFLCFFVPGLPAQAGVVEDSLRKLGEFNQGAQLPTGGEDILPIIIGIINIILGFLALLFIIMILYAGFLYLTAGGVPDKTKKALGIIKDSVIGVAIVILSGVFVNYILIKIIEVVR